MLILKILRELTVKLMHNRGFTLIELLIVITIVAILSTVGIVYYGNFLKSSRDAKRQSDLKFIQSALEAYRADNFSYPADLSLLITPKTYMTKVPNDPKPSPHPDYSYVQSPSSYCLYAVLERANPTSDPGCTLVPPYTYGVTKP